MSVVHSIHLFWLFGDSQSDYKFNAKGESTKHGWQPEFDGSNSQTTTTEIKAISSTIA
jgi:hypothetical protein